MATVRKCDRCGTVDPTVVFELTVRTASGDAGIAKPAGVMDGLNGRIRHARTKAEYPPNLLSQHLIHRFDLCPQCVVLPIYESAEKHRGPVTISRREDGRRMGKPRG
jgi:hypothetical protein